MEYAMLFGRETIKFWREAKTNDIEKVCEGALFQKTHSNNLIETARILSVSNDQFGIPHVKYEVKFERPTDRGNNFEGPRVLALSVFADSYHLCADAH